MNIQRKIKNIVLFIIFLLVIACSHKKENNIFKKNYSISYIGFSSFKPPIDSILNLFVEKANCKDCFYEMYIDRKDFNETVIILRASSNYATYNEKIDLYQDYINKRKPLLYTENNGILFFIYTGMEILLDSLSTTKIVDFNNKKSSIYEYSWVIKIVDEKIEIYEDCWINPFEKTEFLGVKKLGVPK